VCAVIGGQFGSEGKGLAQGYLATRCVNNGEVWAVTSASANAGHTCVLADGTKLVTYHLPMSGVLIPHAELVLSAGAVIDPDVLEAEIDALQACPSVAPIRPRLSIHPRAAVIDKIDVESERNPVSSVTRIASTQHGVGSALARRVTRSAHLAEHTPKLRPYIRAHQLNTHLEHGDAVILEIPQGLGLGLYSGLEYPYCTGREVSVGQGMADAQIDPRRLGAVLMVIRTFPIRVGHIYDKNGKQIGDSGPFYPDSVETSWEEIGVDPEITTVTKRVRRVASFSFKQYQDSLQYLNPSHVFLNFGNYLSEEALRKMVRNMSFSGKVPDLIGLGPRVDQVADWVEP
jgi:adenylosuccinate synthase